MNGLLREREGPTIVRYQPTRQETWTYGIEGITTSSLRVRIIIHSVSSISVFESWYITGLV